MLLRLTFISWLVIESASLIFQCKVKPYYHYKKVSLYMSSSTANYPTTIRAVTSKLTASTQAALQKRTSRMEIELPPGADFGLEFSRKREGKLADDATPTQRVSRSNRDAARLVLEMFSAIATTTVALFPTAEEARSAREMWAPLFRGQVVAIDAPAVKGMGKSPRSRRISAVEQEQVRGGDPAHLLEAQTTSLRGRPTPLQFPMSMYILIICYNINLYIDKFC